MTNLPSIPGLVFRPFRGADDFAGMQRVALASERPDEALEEQFPRSFQVKGGFDPCQHIVLAEVAGALVGYARISEVYEWGEDRGYHLRGYLLPAWQRKGIGSAMLAWSEARVREIEQGRGDGRRIYAHAAAKGVQPGRAALLERAGYQPDRYYHLMTRPLDGYLPAAPLPPGIVVRPARPEHFRAIWSAVVEVAQDEGGGWSPGEEDYLAWLADPLSQPELWQIGWDAAAGTVAGHVLAYIPHEENALSNQARGFSEGIGVVRAWRKRGLATALIALALQALKAAGMTEAALVVDSANPSGAFRLYERFGFRLVERNATYRKLLVGTINEGANP